MSHRIATRILLSSRTNGLFVARVRTLPPPSLVSSPRFLSAQASEPLVVNTKAEKNNKPETEKVVTAACGDVNDDDDDDEMEKEEMFVDPHDSFEHRVREWGGPRRGGRLPEPTRFGDWERKGRCTDF